MKNITHLFLLLFGILSAPNLQAQWVPQADNIFGISFSPDAHRAVNDQVNWAGVNQFPWSSAPTLSAWITRTKDGGATWQFSQIPGAEGYVAWGISALDANQAWVSLNYRADRSKSRIYRTQDGGNTWQKQFEGPGAGYGVHFFDAQNGVMLRGKFYRHTSDGGATWSDLDSFPAVNNSVFLIVTESYTARQDTIWYPTVDGKISKSTDKGKTWQTLSTALEADGVSANMLDFADGRHGLAAALYSGQINSSGFYPALPEPQLYSTSDGGLTWQKIPNANLPIPADDISISAIGAVPGLPRTFMMMAGYYDDNFNYFSNLYQSDNGGYTWKLLATNPATFGLQSLEFLSPTSGWGGIGGDFAPGVPYFFRWNGSIVDTDEATADNSPLQLTPNPASDRLTLRLPDEAAQPNLTAFIFDAQGRLLLRNSMGIYQEIDIGHLPAGAYTAMVQNASGKIVGVKKWVKGE